MAKNKATVQDENMTAAFRQGFEEGIQQAVTSMVVYEFKASFEGTELRQVQFMDLETALEEARTMLLNGGGVTITINAVAVPTQQPVAPQAVASAPEDDIEDAEVVEDSPPDAVSTEEK